jgi:hypothetical protein
MANPNKTFTQELPTAVDKLQKAFENLLKELIKRKSLMVLPDGRIDSGLSEENCGCCCAGVEDEDWSYSGGDMGVYSCSTLYEDCHHTIIKVLILLLAGRTNLATVYADLDQPEPTCHGNFLFGKIAYKNVQQIKKQLESGARPELHDSFGHVLIDEQWYIFQLKKLTDDVNSVVRCIDIISCNSGSVNSTRITLRVLMSFWGIKERI